MNHVIDKMKTILISGLTSGMGKTVVTGGLIRCFSNMGYDVLSYKCGPDYIDPKYHMLISGKPCRNLDIFLQGKEGVISSFDRSGAEIKIIEGVMGFYDGVGGGVEGSTFEISRLTGASVILTVDPAKTLDVVDEIKKMLSVREDHGIIGVIYTDCNEEEYLMIKEETESKTGLKVYGYLPKTEDAKFESRHLGLVEACEIKDLQQRFDRIAELLDCHSDLKGLLDDTASYQPEMGETSYYNKSLTLRKRQCKIAVARDEAFSFYYEDNLDALREAGAELVFFSPIRDGLPDADGLYIGGGYPELHLKELSENTSLLRRIREAAVCGMPIVAECGGFLYLQSMITDKSGKRYPMAGVIKGEGIPGDRLNSRFGYIRIYPEKDSLLFRLGEEIPAHEFHYWDCTECGEALEAKKADGRKWRTGFVSDSIYAGFPHFYFRGEYEMASRFVNKAKEYRAGRIAFNRWMSLAKPLGSLGVLEKDIIRMAELTGSEDVSIARRTLLVFIGDHGLVEEGVTQSDHTVTYAVAKALGSGRSTVNYPAMISKCEVIPVDVGMKDDAPDGVLRKKVSRGSRNITKCAAMTREECIRAVDIGRDMVRKLKEQGNDVILLGEMGIGNTTASAAIASVMLGLDPSKTVGRGAGLSDDGLSRKKEAVSGAIRVNDPDKNDPLDVLAKLGGFEIASLCGACMAGFEYRIPVILDGVITNTAALIACRMKPDTSKALFASHLSTEPAAKMILDELGLDTIISAGVRLGEGIGAVMALSILDQALAVYNSGHTFERLGIEPYVPL